MQYMRKPRRIPCSVSLFWSRVRDIAIRWVRECRRGCIQRVRQKGILDEGMLAITRRVGPVRKANRSNVSCRSEMRVCTHPSGTSTDVEDVNKPLESRNQRARILKMSLFVYELSVLGAAMKHLGTASRSATLQPHFSSRRRGPDLDGTVSHAEICRHRFLRTAGNL